LVAALQPRTTPGSRTPRHAAPPEESIVQGGRGGRGGEVPPRRGPHCTRLQWGRCRRDHCCHRCGAFASRQRSQRRRRGRPWTLILPISCRCAAAAASAAAAAASVSVCVGVRRHCCRHCHGGNLAVILAPSATIATAVGGGRTRMIAS
jgi:hypothetical protein